MSKKIPILMYHNVSNIDDKKSVLVKNFLKQMLYMKNSGFVGIALRDLQKSLNNKKFVITFDDGYKDIFTLALPILRELKFNATCFVINNSIGKNNKWDNSFLNIGNENEINLWLKHGNEIGSHSKDHLNLCKISDTELVNQIEKSRNELNNKFNIEVNSFSYPFGRYNFKALQVVKKNYIYAVTTKRSRYISKKHDLHELPRIPINYNTNIFKFYLKTKTFYEDVK